jgi:hypothetical protein
VFGLDDENWARHANPWSVWTRFAGFPLLILAVWSRSWFGVWSLAFIAAAVVWIYINPRFFPKPASTDNWASRSVLGERIWMNRNAVAVPEHQREMPNLLSLVGVAGVVFVGWGLYIFDPLVTILGWLVVFLGKLWFLDRMVWLYQEMKDSDMRYRSWLY